MSVYKKVNPFKVRCVDNTGASDNLVVGRVYTVVEQTDEYYALQMTPEFTQGGWSKDRFQPFVGDESK